MRSWCPMTKVIRCGIEQTSNGSTRPNGMRRGEFSVYRRRPACRRNAIRPCVSVGRITWFVKLSSRARSSWGASDVLVECAGCCEGIDRPSHPRSPSSRCYRRIFLDMFGRAPRVGRAGAVPNSFSPRCLRISSRASSSASGTPLRRAGGERLGGSRSSA